MSVNRYYSSTAQATTLNGAINSSATTVVVNATTGFPGSFPYTLILERDTVNEEVIKVTAAAGTTLTVVRAQDGTSGVSHSNGATVEHGVSAQDFSEPQTHIAATSGAHGITGSFVGTSDSQTLTNKTVALGSNTVSGTTAQFNTALSDNDFATLAGSETLTNKTLTSPTINTPTVATPTVTAMTADAASTIGGVSGTTLAADRAAWTSYTPTFTGATSPTGDFYYKQVGKRLYVRGHFTGGTQTGATVISLSLPASLSAAATGRQIATGADGGGTIRSFVILGGASTLGANFTLGTGGALANIVFSGVIEVA